MVEDESFPGRIHFVWHAIREIRNRLPDAVAGPVYSSNLEYSDLIEKIAKLWTDEGHLVEVTVPLNAVETAPSTPGGPRKVSQELYDATAAVVAAYALIPGRNEQNARRLFNAISGGTVPNYAIRAWTSITRRAHKLAHAGINLPDPKYQQSLAADFERFEQAILVLANRSYVNMDNIDTILDSGVPDSSDAIAILATRSENRSYFFDHLEDPLWLANLSAWGYFAEPPPPEPTGEAGAVRFPQWPEGRYLYRMADVAPNDVATILITIRQPQNPIVTRLLFEIADKLRIRQLRRLKERLPEWVCDNRADYYVQAATSIIVRLLRSSKPSDLEVAYRVLMELLKPEPSRTTMATPSRMGLQLRGRCSDWEYQNVIELITEDLLESSGLRAFDFANGLLQTALDVGQAGMGQAAGYLEYSHIWRPSIKPHDQNSSRGLVNILVTFTAEVVLATSLANSDDAVEVFAVLRAGDILRQRISLFLLAQPGLLAHELQGITRDFSALDTSAISHEFAEILRSRFNELSTERRQEYYKYVDTGPDTDHYIQWSAVRGMVISTAELQDFCDMWRRDRLSFIEGYLETDRRKQYNLWCRQYGNPEHPDFSTWHESGGGLTSPFQGSDLDAMAPEDVAVLVGNWSEPSNAQWHDLPSRAGLGDAFERTVARNPTGYANSIDEFVGRAPSYVGSLLAGLEVAARQGEDIPWELVLPLSGAVGSDSQHPYMKQLLSLVSYGLEMDSSSGIKLALRNAVWEVVMAAVNEYGAQPPEMASASTIESDIYPLVFDTIYGNAVYASVRYGLWVLRQAGSQVAHPETGIGEIPELREFVELQLALPAETCSAVHAILGRWLPWLFLIDREWTSQIVPKIFPPDSAVQYEAAWNSYIIWCEPYTTVYAGMEEFYMRAIQSVPTRPYSRDDRDSSIDLRLGEHLMRLYWQGVAEMPLVIEVFERGGDQLASDVVSFASMALANASAPIEKATTDCFVDLWRTRLESASAHEVGAIEELRQYVEWFASGRIPDEQTVPLLIETTRLVGAPDHLQSIGERLQEVAREQPSEAACILVQILMKVRSEWEHLVCQDAAYVIASLALDSAQPKAENDAKEIIDYYVARGSGDFRGLIS